MRDDAAPQYARPQKLDGNMSHRVPERESDFTACITIVLARLIVIEDEEAASDVHENDSSRKTISFACHLR